jgi:hypothetical protein
MLFNQKTYIVDPWGEVNRRYGSMAGESETIARFNPLSILDPESDEYVDDLAYLADALIISQSSRDPHWDDSARELVAGLIAFVVESPAYSAEASLALVRGLLSLPGPELRVVIKDAQALGPEASPERSSPASMPTPQRSIRSCRRRARRRPFSIATFWRGTWRHRISVSRICAGETSRCIWCCRPTSWRPMRGG